MSASDGVAAAASKKIEFDDPHANMQEAEVTRVRTLRGGWRVALMVATAATIMLCINQQFSLRFFIGYTQLNTEYFYLLIALMLPFTFLIFPGTENAPLDRIPWYDLLLFVLTFAASIVLMRTVRKAAEAGWEFGGAPTSVIVAGLIMWFVLMEALRRMLIEGGQLPLNRPGAAGWVHDGYVWFVCARLAEEVRSYLSQHESLQGIPGKDRNDRLFDTWQESGACRPAPDGGAVWRVRVECESWSPPDAFTVTSRRLSWSVTLSGPRTAARSLSSVK